MKNPLRSLDSRVCLTVCLLLMGIANSVHAQTETASSHSQKSSEASLEYPLYVPGRQLGIEALLLKHVDDTRNSKNVGVHLLALHQAWTSIQIKQTYSNTAKLLFEVWLSDLAKAPEDIQKFFCWRHCRASIGIEENSRAAFCCFDS